MFDTTESAPTAPKVSHQRVRGEAHVGLRLRERRTVLRDLRQAGSAKAFLPRCHTADPEAVFLNTAGGLTGGDRLKLSLSAEPGTRVTATTQTAERAYASNMGSAHLDVAIRAGAGAHVAWLPQETILFEKSSLKRRTIVDLEGDASVLLVETVILGRTAMGERLDDIDFLDRREIRRDGRPVVLDPMRLSSRVLERRASPTLLNGAVATSAIHFVAPGAEDRVAQLRAVIDQHTTPLAGVSGWDGRLVVRALSHDAQALRRLVGQCLTVLSGHALPRVWQL